MTTLYILACSMTKSNALREGPVAARDAYIGQYFRIARRLLEDRGESWCILSGHYGFLWPSTRIEFYDVMMEPVTEETQWDECFGLLSNRQFAKLRTADRVVVLGSQLYADAAAVLLGRPVEAPTSGLPIGKAMQALKRGGWLKIAAA